MIMIPAGLESIGTLQEVELFVASAHLESPVGTALHQHRERRVGFVRVRASRAEGFGELAAMDQVVGTDPSLEVVLARLATQWIPRLFDAAGARAGQCPPSHAVGVLGGSSAADRMAAAALEMAILDAELRLAERSLATWLEVGPARIPFGALCGIPASRDVGELVASAEAAIEGGAARLRIKIEPDWAEAPLRSLRAVLPSALLQADANGSLAGTAGRTVLQSIDELQLTCIEEPLGGSDLTASAALSVQLTTPVCLDETITTPRAVRDAIRYRSCRVLCVKPGRLGGIRAAMRALEEANASGLDCFMGGMFEAGLGRSVLGALAGRPEASLVGDVAGASSYLVQDPCGQPGPTGDRQELYSGPGVGPWPDLSLLKRR